MAKFDGRALALIAGAAGLLIGAAALAGEPAFRYPEAEFQGATLKYVDDIPVATLHGTPVQIGEQQAALFKDALGELVDTPRRVLAGFGVNEKLVLPVAAVAARALAENAPERYRQEMDALARAAHVDANVLYVGNSLVELRRMGGCAAFIVGGAQSETGKPLFGRNFDFPTFDVLDKYSCVLIVQPEHAHAYASVTVPGFVGVVSGMNDAGLVIATLDVYSSADGSPIFDLQGAPLALTYRRILEDCSSVEEARQLLEQTPRTTYMNLAVCDTRRAVVFEITPKTVGVRSPEGAVLRCTNHFELPELKTSTDCDRYATLGELAGLHGKRPYTLDDVHRAMHSVNQGPLTFQTMIFEPGEMRLRLAFGPGPISDRPLHVLALTSLFQTAGSQQSKAAADEAP